MGLSPQDAARELAELESFVTVLSESADVYRRWKTILILHKVRGVHAHDARLVAAMQAHGVKQLLTFDAGDFAKYNEIEILHPNGR